MTGEAVTDLVVRNARVCTLDKAHPWAGAVAVRAGRISWVGEDADAGDRVGPGTQVIDAGGRLVLPGFIDSHNHVRLGSDADCVQLGGAGSLDQVRARVAAWLGEHRDAEWVEGEGLDYPALRPGPADLDGVAGARPVFLFDGRQLDSLAEFEAARRRYDDTRLRVAPVKLYIDDSIDLHTAALFEPYADEPTTRGGTFTTRGSSPNW